MLLEHFLLPELWCGRNAAKRNIYTFTTRRTSWWGIRAAWVHADMHPYTIYRARAALHSKDIWLYPSECTAVCISAFVWHFYLRFFFYIFETKCVPVKIMRVNLRELMCSKTSECNLIWLEVILWFIHLHKGSLTVKVVAELRHRLCSIWWYHALEWI